MHWPILLMHSQNLAMLMTALPATPRFSVNARASAFGTSEQRTKLVSMIT
jgi:hypothetical protein